MATSGRPISRAKRMIASLTCVLLGDAVVLDLEVDVLRPEDLDQLVQVRAGLVQAALDDPRLAAGGEAARERDHAVGVPASSSMSTPGLPLYRPSRNPPLESFTRFRKPSSFWAISVRWLRSIFPSRTVRSSTK